MSEVASRLPPTAFGTFDTCSGQEGRAARLNGPIATGLMATTPTTPAPVDALSRGPWR